MTLIFTNPLFTMIFAAVFLGHRLTLIKSFAGKELTRKIRIAKIIRWEQFRVFITRRQYVHCI